ncbi:MAG: cobalamin-binding protein [Gelidibacter sp.]|nr:cobalamin-binding protein [Gelidibacter sp.]
MIPTSEDFLHYLLKGNRKMCATIAKNYLVENPSIKDLYEEVFKEALYEVGRLWEANKITVATEHLATAITEGILNELYGELDIPETKHQHKVVLACASNEAHQVGVKMVADVFEMNGWESYFLGTGIPMSELVKFIQQTEPAVVAISLSIFFNYRNLVEMIAVLKSEFPNLTIIVGGQGFLHQKEGSFEKLENIKYISNLYELDTYLKSI